MSTSCRGEAVAGADDSGLTGRRESYWRVWSAWPITVPSGQVSTLSSAESDPRPFRRIAVEGLLRCPAEEGLGDADGRRVADDAEVGGEPGLPEVDAPGAVEDEQVGVAVAVRRARREWRRPHGTTAGRDVGLGVRRR